MAAAPPKKSRFNRPAWSKAPVQTENSDREFFRHASNSYAAIAAEKVLQREERQRQVNKQQEDGRQRDTHGREKQSKRRRLSTEEEDSHASKGSGVRVKAEDGDSLKEAPIGESEASPRKPDWSKRLEPQVSASVIDLEDEDTKDAVLPTLDEDSTTGYDARQTRSKAKPGLWLSQKAPYYEDESEDDDDYMREIKRKAREKAHQKRLEKETKISKAPNNLPDASQSPSFHAPGSPPATTQAPPQKHVSQISTETNGAHTPPPVEDDPIIEILIQSSIPKTNPLLVRRRASQPLADVRLAWCQRQLFEKSMTSKVFFTWRGNRVFDVTTCRNFLTQSEKESTRDVFETDWESKAAESPRIEVIATTEEILEQTRKHEETLKAAANSNDDNVIDADRESASAEPIKETKLRVILRSPGMSDVQLKVSPSHYVKKIIAAFRQQQGLETGKNVYLLFDGDRLEEDATVQETGIEDLDTVDVQVR